MRTITERLAKRIKRGQLAPDAKVLRWAEQYAMVRRFGRMLR